jgi:hypothetical protein
MRGPKSDAELEAFASQHKDELSRTLSELHTQDHESFRLQSEVCWQVEWPSMEFCGVFESFELKHAWGMER